MLLANSPQALHWIGTLDGNALSIHQTTCLIALQKHMVDAPQNPLLENLLMSDKHRRLQVIEALTNERTFAVMIQHLLRTVGLISGWFPTIVHQYGYTHLVQQQRPYTACEQPLTAPTQASVWEHTRFDCLGCQDAFMQTLDYGHSINVYLRKRNQQQPQSEHQHILQLFERGIPNFFLDQHKRVFAGQGSSASQQPLTLKLFDDAATQLHRQILQQTSQLYSFEQLHSFTAQQWFETMFACCQEVISWRGWTFNNRASANARQQFIDVFPRGTTIDYSKLSRAMVALTFEIDKSQQFAVPWLG